MKRWHAEIEHMKRQMRLERQKHGVDPDNHDGAICHCLLGIGFVRKRKAHDCGNPRCGLCHFSKYFMRGSRRHDRDRAIVDQLEHS